MSKNEPYVNQELLDRVLKAKEYARLHDDSFKIWEKEALEANEKRYLSNLGKCLQNTTQEELAVMVLVAVQNYPEMVFQIIMEEFLVNKERKDKKHDDRKDV